MPAFLLRQGFEGQVAGMTYSSLMLVLSEAIIVNRWLSVSQNQQFSVNHYQVVYKSYGFISSG
jgi:hypothetical protein